MGLLKYKNAFLVVALALLLNYLILLLQTPSSPKDLYRVLGVSQTADTSEINAAFNRLYQPLSIEPTVAVKEKLLDLRHAHDILSDERKRRVYDTFQVDVLQEAKDHEWDVQPDMMSHPSHDLSETQSLTSQNFDKLVLESDDVWVILLYSETTSHELSAVTELLTGVAKVGRVEIEDQLPLSIALAEKTRYTKQPRFMSGLPEVAVFTPTCSRFGCVTRYRGVKTAPALTEWIATSVLKLPQVFHPRSVRDLIHKFPHKVKVLVFSRSRAPLYIRQAAKKYHDHAMFAMVTWEEHIREFLGDPDLGKPEVVFLKDPGLKPVVYQGSLNSSELERLMEEHKTFVLPQLRSISVEALGCDARGNSLAGNETTTWYCVIVAGRTGRVLSKMRGLMRGVLQNLTETELGVPATEVAPQQGLLAAEALRSRRLSLSWLDGEKQKEFCYFYLHSPTMFEACGPARYGEVEDVPKIFLIRYHRKPERLEKEKLAFTWASLLSEDSAENVASQLVSIYNGSADVGDIVQWMSQMVYEGDTQELPGFGGRMPELVPEETVSFWTDTMKIVVDGQARAVQNSEWFSQWASKIDMNLLPVLFFLFIFFASHLFLHRQKVLVVGPAGGGEQSSSGVCEGNVG